MGGDLCAPYCIAARVDAALAIQSSGGAFNCRPSCMIAQVDTALTMHSMGHFPGPQKGESSPRPAPSLCGGLKMGRLGQEGGGGGSFGSEAHPPPNKFLTQNLAEGKSNLNERPLCGTPPRPPPLLVLLPHQQRPVCVWGDIPNPFLNPIHQICPPAMPSNPPSGNPPDAGHSKAPRAHTPLGPAGAPPPSGAERVVCFRTVLACRS